MGLNGDKRVNAPKLKSDEVGLIVEAYENMSLEEIAKHLGVNKTTVRYHLLKRGIIPRGRGNERKEADGDGKESIG